MKLEWPFPPEMHLHFVEDSSWLPELIGSAVYLLMALFFHIRPAVMS